MTFQADYRDSAFTSEYYPMFVELGYPQLDIKRWEDGEWAILEMDNAPVVPSLTRWKYILTGLRHIEITSAFLARYVRQIDPRFPEFWEREAAKSKAIEDEQAWAERAREDVAMKTAKELLKNEALKERVARYGVRELTPEWISYRLWQSSERKARDLGVRVTDVPKGAIQ